ncbi:hypothetical protein LCGC14_0418200 [marine sediment metagenome]|uniref:Glycosyltransferase 2-like domain-containing protein n=1 Tax=marine sediment metagenome TaxID=412755 RepID=A0A0F9SXT8_9ZZZZ
MISIHVNITNPETRGFAYLEAIQSYVDLADEVIVVDGGSDDGSVEKIEALSDKITVVENHWPQTDWLWDQLARNTKFGYEACNGDWAIKMDLDYMIHERDIKRIRERLDEMLTRKFPPMTAAFEKFQFQIADKCFSKSKTHIAVNKKHYGEFLNYGRAYDSDTDFMWAIHPEHEVNGLYIGKSVIQYAGMIERIGYGVYCYDLTFMTLKQLEEVRPIYDYARAKYYNSNHSDERVREFASKAMQRLQEFFVERWNSSNWRDIPLKKHPKYIQDRLKAIREDQFGYNNFGWLGDVKITNW